MEDIKKLLKAYKQDEKIIQEMAEYIEDTVEDDICNKENCFADKYENGHCQKCVNCIIDYFRNRCE